MNLEYYKCPLTGKIMFDPVSTSDGQAFEREAIDEWLTKNQTNPISGAKLSNLALIPNQILKNMINDYLKIHTSHFERDEVYLSPKVLGETKSHILEKDQKKLKFKLDNLNDYRYFTTDLNDSGSSAFYMAAEAGSLEATKEIFEYLFRKGLLTQIGDVTKTWRPNNLNGLIKSYLENPYGDLEKVKIQKLLEFDSYARKIDELYLENIFMNLDDIEVVKWLFESKLVSVEKKDENGNTLLMRAAIKRHLQLFAFLLFKGADLNAINSNNENCYIICLKNGYMDIFDVIVDDLTVKKSINGDIKGMKEHVLHLTMMLFPNRPELIEQIIKSNKSLIEQTDANARTPLFVACQMNDIEAIKVLIKNGSNVNHVDKKGKNCLHLAVEKHYNEFQNQKLREELLSILIEKNINVFQIDEADKTPLDMADRKTKNFLFQKINEKNKCREEEIESLRNNLMVLMEDVKALSSKLDDLKN